MQNRRLLPPLNALRAFEAVVRLGSVTRAAEEFGVTPGAVSRQVKTLEAFAGRSLLVNSGRGVEATPMAREFAKAIGTAFDQIERSAERVASPSTRHLVRVNSSHAFVLHWLFPRLQGFERAHSEARVEVVTSMEAPPQAAGFDLAIRRYPMEVPGFVCEELVADYAIPVAAPELLRSSPIRRPADLGGHTLLFCGGHAGVWEQWLDAAGVQLDCRISYFERFYTLIESARSGRGVALGPITLVDQSLQGKRLVAPLPFPRVPLASFHIAYPQDLAKGSVIRRFVAWLKGEASAFEARSAALSPQDAMP